ncbi:hypothetical protein FRZ67_22130 [Panacibacter ginsenosidivorans]|uniref:Lipoprotein n=1 Tax=Panacibacter ginsenosidivorans TaxID=1813871 RepID=A0A5B8VFH4_9BACT|nr:hypothetical protein [Panacibacter ginsenosidivorans]QEC69863.1 hypothetical protein FRZ67_22130 [Panacibacter ginsenosidivorans]
MNKQGGNIIPVILFAVILCIIFSCENNHASDKTKIKSIDSVNTNKTKKISHKPYSTFQDTLKVSKPSAVFFHPDSLQLEKIKQQTDSTAFKDLTHVDFYLTQNARNVIRNAWPSLNIIEARSFRYLLFLKKDGSKEYIDLDQYVETFGLFLFDGKKSPKFVDMMNVDTELYFYFKK